MYAGGRRDSSAPRILVVRLGAMGDIIHALPAVASLKHGWPRSHLTWAVAPQWVSLLQHNPFIDEVVIADRHHPIGLLRVLRASRFDFAVDFQGLLKSALIASLARADRIFGFHRSELREKIAAWLYSNLVLSRASHVVDKNLELAAAAGATSMLRTFPLPLGESQGVLPTAPFVLANPLAGWTSKQWPLQHYRRLAELLKRELGMPLVLNGPAGWQASVPEIHLHLSGLPGLIDATRRATAIVGVDSGPMHLAAALGRPGVAIFGPTDPARNGPYGNTVAVLRSPRAVTSYKRRTAIDPSMLDVTPEAVLQTLKSQLMRHPDAAVPETVR